MAKKKVKSKTKPLPKPSSIPESITNKVIAEAYSAKAQPVFMKVCRLCESKDGPFLNIFDADKITAKKIDELMPFGVTENDDLPHKICFRCSAKLEELYEFIQKCIKTQENLRTAIGKTGPFITKTKTRVAWEEKLNKTNMSNDDICDALIKKAMAGIKDIPLKPLPVEEEPVPLPTTKRVTRRSEPKKDSTSDDNEEPEMTLKNFKLSMDKCDEKIPVPNTSKAKTEPTKPGKTKPQPEKKVSEIKVKTPAHINNFSFDYDDGNNVRQSSESEEEVKEEPKKKPEPKPETKKPEVKNPEEKPETKPEKPFNIMDYISMIKVNGVGVLFQCKLCNRNFLKKEVVETHYCAKNGVPKVEAPKTIPAPEPPKAPTVKYIKMDGDMKKTLSMKSKLEQDNTHNDDDKRNSSQINIRQEENSQSTPPVKPKPKIGPASKTRRLANDSDVSSEKDSDSQHAPSTNSQSPAVHIPAAPNLNGRYKLVPGPNNIFTLVEDSSAVPEQVKEAVKESQKHSRKRKSEESGDKSNRKKESIEKSSEVIDLDDPAKPYPVGLFQTVGHATAIYPPAVNNAAPFTTPAMKKQSYTIVQTGNPSKLLISTKAQAPPEVPPKKRPRKSKIEPREDKEPNKEPFKVTLEDVAPAKDPGFFTFINVDPLLQPSYVLPTDNIIQESQISTSTAVRNAMQNSKEKDKYSCNMCGETFTREKKLLAHIQSHYAKMDEEDEKRTGKSSKKKGKK